MENCALLRSCRKIKIPLHMIYQALRPVFVSVWLGLCCVYVCLCVCVLQLPLRFAAPFGIFRAAIALGRKMLMLFRPSRVQTRNTTRINPLIGPTFFGVASSICICVAQCVCVRECVWAVEFISTAKRTFSYSAWNSTFCSPNMRSADLRIHMYTMHLYMYLYILYMYLGLKSVHCS